MSRPRRGPNARAAERTIRQLVRDGAVDETDRALLELARTTAAALDTAVTRIADGDKVYPLAPLARAHLAALVELRRALSPIGADNTLEDIFARLVDAEEADDT